MDEKQDLFDPRALQGDDGKTEMVIFTNSGKVIMRFARPMLFIAFDANNAAELANNLLNRAKECGAEIQINVPKKKITREQRDVLVTRALHVQRSMTEKHRPPAIIAQNVVDTILSAIE